MKAALRGRLSASGVVRVSALMVPLLFSTGSRADTYQEFYTQGTFQSGASLDGFIVVDDAPADGIPYISDLALNVSGPDNLQFNGTPEYFGGSGVDNVASVAGATVSGSPNAGYISLFLPENTSGPFSSYDGGPIATSAPFTQSAAVIYNDNGAENDYLSSGIVSPDPIPSTLPPSPLLASSGRKVLAGELIAPLEDFADAYDAVSIGLSGTPAITAAAYIVGKIDPDIGLTTYAQDIVEALKGSNLVSFAFESEALLAEADAEKATEIAKDPPSSNYQAVYFPSAFSLNLNGDLEGVSNSALIEKTVQDEGNFGEVLDALLESAERFDGARMAGAVPYEQLQYAAYLQYLQESEQDAEALSSDLTAQEKVLPSLTSSELNSALASLNAVVASDCASGLPSGVENTLESAGFSKSSLATAVCGVTGTTSVTSANIATQAVINPLQSYAVSAAPEPSTWQMLVLGIGALGVPLRLRKRFKVDTRPVRTVTT